MRRSTFKALAPKPLLVVKEEQIAETSELHNPRLFSCLVRTKKHLKKHKNWELDGFLVVDAKQMGNLLDNEGKSYVGSALIAFLRCDIL